MSKEISTLVKDIVINSLAKDGKYRLRVVQDGRVTAYNTLSYKEYGKLLKDLWDNYINKGEKPQLLEQNLPDTSLVDETLHFIAPDSFFWPDGLPLEDYRESFIYWIKSNYDKIRSSINDESFKSLDCFIDGILKMHLARKQKKKD
ncbi:hypothetical protein KY342_03910 [Candidatus Woesearchaeota archaeon]|nr:hypothetical protein [Candidatus Woesearchaeota archaeon]